MQNITRLTLLIACIALFQAGLQRAEAQEITRFYDAVDGFMGEYVDGGLVDYEAVKNQPAQLDALLQQIATLNREDLSPQDEKAYLINTYNVLVIKNIVDHYPTTSPKEENGFFDRDEFQVSGKSQTLDDVEKGDLFTKYPDPRLHFVLVCAALGCPQLISEAYRGNTLDEKLTMQTRYTLNNSYYVALEASGNKVNVSELFSWYEKDFTNAGISVIDYINQYRKDTLPENARVGYITYDWQLNDAKKRASKKKS